MMPRLLRFLALGLALATAACLPETEHFLADPGAQPNDQRLIGTWFFQEKNARTTTVVAIIPQGKDHVSVTWVDVMPRKETGGDKPGPVRWLRYTGFTTRIAGNDYINLDHQGGVWPNRAPKRLIIRYWVEAGKTLRFAAMRSRALRKAIEAGTLAGRKTKDDVWVVTAPRDKLLAWIARVGPDEAFGKPSAAMRKLPVTEK
jgi:hypothetical protein